MKKWIGIETWILLAITILSHAQVIHTTAALDVDNVFTGSNQFTKSILLGESICTSGIPSNTVLCASSSTHRLQFNPNNTGLLSVVGISSPSTPGNCPQFAANGIDLVDSGSTSCGGGGGGVGGSGTLNKIPLWTPNGITLGNSTISQATDVITMNDTVLNFTPSTTAESILVSNGQLLLSTSSSGTTDDRIQITVGQSASGQPGHTLTLNGGASGTGGGPGGSATIRAGNNVDFGGGGQVIMTSASSSTFKGSVVRSIGDTSQIGMFNDANGPYEAYFNGINNVGTNALVMRWGNGVPSFNCGAGGSVTMYVRGDAPNVSSAIYLCLSGTTWTAITVP